MNVHRECEGAQCQSDLDDRLDEHSLAKVKRVLTLRAISRQVLPKWIVVATVDEFEDLSKTAHTIVLVWECHTMFEQESHVLIIKHKCLKERAQLLKYLEVSGHECASERGRLIKRWRRGHKEQDNTAVPGPAPGRCAWALCPPSSCGCMPASTYWRLKDLKISLT